MYYSLRIIAGIADSFATAAADYYFSRRVMAWNRERGDDSEEANVISDRKKFS